MTNLTSGGTMEQIGFLVNLGVIPHICNMLTVKESKVVLVILDALGNVLLVGGGSTLFCRFEMQQASKNPLARSHLRVHSQVGRVEF